MLFKSYLPLFLLISTLGFMFSILFANSFCLNFIYFSFSSNFLDNYNFCIGETQISMIFIFMVGLVTSLVVLYSEFYMEIYNNKKFIILLLMFFTSMMLLSLSDSLILLMLGWDGLGITSICLIMFYPNKTTLVNSILTMFFNRLGDVLLIIFLGLMAFNQNLFYVLSTNLDFEMYLIMICAATKSAQFPLSSWLPAAMSAPTPISAMVHSSTLVTAGVFLMSKFSFTMSTHHTLMLMMFISVLSFLSGGFMAFLELDFKKTIAFSTMSQISMIMFFCCSLMFYFCLMHTFFHALFKTLLFCSAGSIFVSAFSDQIFKNFGSSSFLSLNTSLIYFSVFSMTGLIFSCSFFSKDMLLEFFCSCSNIFFFIFLVTGSLLTILYCSKLLSLIKFKALTNKTNYFKSLDFKFLIIFSIFSLLSGVLMKNKFIFSASSFMGAPEVILVSLLLFMFFIMKIYNFNFNFFYEYSGSISFMKLFSFSVVSNLMKSNFSMPVFTDSLIFKPYLFESNKNKIFYLQLNKFTWLLIMMMIMFYFF